MVNENPNASPATNGAGEAKRKKNGKHQGFWGNTRVVIEALLIAAAIHTLLFRPFYIPSGSMKPNLLIGDYIIVNKFSYGYSRYSCYFNACPIEGRIFGKQAERGDVVVFAHPQGGHHVVKRVIGLPGDTVQMHNSQLYINGEQVPVEMIENFTEPKDGYKPEPICENQSDETCQIPQYIETLPGGFENRVLNQSNTAQLDTTSPFVVPEAQYFVMGDNRDNSGDSRVFGFLPEDHIVGKAKLIVFSSAGSSLFQVWKWRGDRFFKWVE